MTLLPDSQSTCEHVRASASLLHDCFCDSTGQLRVFYLHCTGTLSLRTLAEIVAFFPPVRDSQIYDNITVRVLLDTGLTSVGGSEHILQVGTVDI